MKVTYTLPIESIRGCIGPDYYARVLNGRYVVQHRPCRKGHIPSDKQLAARRSFIATCPGTKWQQFRPNHADAGGSVR